MGDRKLMRINCNKVALMGLLETSNKKGNKNNKEGNTQLSFEY